MSIYIVRSIILKKEADRLDLYLCWLIQGVVEKKPKIRLISLPVKILEY